MRDDPFHGASPAPVRGGVGLVLAWEDAAAPTTWSGVVRGLTRGLAAHGAYAGWWDATPWPPTARAVYRWLGRTRRLDAAWTFRPEASGLLAASAAVKRRRPPPSARSVDAWIVPVGAIGCPAPGPVAALVEIAPADLARMDLATAASFWPGLTARSRSVLVRRQLAAIHRATVVCTASHWAARTLVEEHGLDPARVHVIGYGRNLEVAAVERDWSQPRFLFFGTHWDRKGGASVLRAFRRLRTEVPAARLDVVGGHPPIDEPGVMGHGGAIGLADAIRRAHIEDLLQRATALVVPSVVEPFGIVYAEAGHAGIGSIATTAGGTATSVGDGGLRIPPRDDEALLDAMRTLAEPAEAAACGARAQAHARRLTWEQTAGRILQALGLEVADPPASLSP